ncbi:hypothetical protein MASR2M117_25370 [Paludibacter sp.]
MREDWIECTFEDLLDYEQPTKYIVRSTKYSDDYKTPVLTAGKSFIKGYTNETDGIFNELPTIIFDDFTTATQFVDFPFKVKSSAMKILVPTSKLVNMKYLFNCIQVNQVRNDTHKRYWISVYAKKKLLLPPLVVQNAILSKTEELFSDLDNGIANFKKAQEQLKVFRQAVLKKAFEGKLSELGKVGLKDDKMTDRENEEILQSQNPKNPNSDKKEDNLPKGWKWVKLGEVATITSSKRIFQHEYVNEGIPFYRTKEIKELSEGKKLTFELFISENKYNDIKTKFPIPKIGDILLSAVGTIGVSYVVKDEKPFYFKDGNLMWFKDLSGIDPYFLSYGLTSLIRHKNEAKTSGSAYSALTIETMKRFDFPLPTNLQEQSQIVQEIESRLSVCDKMEQSINESILKAEALRQSILKKAFEGKLLSEAEIAQCKQAADYEPASELLKKIQAEKLAKEQEKKKKPTVKKKSKK